MANSKKIRSWRLLKLPIEIMKDLLKNQNISLISWKQTNQNIALFLGNEVDHDQNVFFKLI